MINYLAVAIGGALGAMSRYWLGVWILSKWQQSFPWHTFLINISGAFLLGFLNTLFLNRSEFNPLLQVTLGVGFLGAFTTFSTFGYEVMMLVKEGTIATALLYVVSSVFIGLMAVALGVALARLF